MTSIRPVFYVSDGTGITAETIGHSLLTQFGDTRFTTDRIPFVDTPEKARETALRIREAGEAARHRDAQVGQLTDHFAERGVLAAHLGEVGQAQVVQPKDVGAQGGAPCEGKAGDRRRRCDYFSNPVHAP